MVVSKTIFRCILLTILTTTQLLSLHFLHLSFHKGCINEITMIARQLGFEVTSVFIPDLAARQFDGYSSGNALYNMGHDRASSIWNKHADYFNQFDGIITSDTTPLARIFLQNNYKKPLIIWVCNRFDYTDHESLDCAFPDKKYYQLFQQALTNENVYIVPYTAFESFYAAEKEVIFNFDVIKPSGIHTAENNFSIIPISIDKENTFFIPPYLNDRIIPTRNLGIKTYCGRYNGASDLKDFRGIIHIPYAWSNVAFFENIQQEIPYFVPSFTFMTELLKSTNIWWQNGDLLQKNHHLSEWYNEENSAIITYFDSWEDLKYKIESTNFDLLKTQIKSFAHIHKTRMIEKWNTIMRDIKNNIHI